MITATLPPAISAAIIHLVRIISAKDREIGHLNRQLIMERMRLAELRPAIITQSDDLPCSLPPSLP